MSSATDTIYRNKFKYTIHQYKRSFLQSSNLRTKVTSSPDDGSRKYLGGKNKLWKAYQPILDEYHKINPAT